MEAQDILGSETGRGPFSQNPRAEGRQAVDKGAGAYRDAGDKYTAQGLATYVNP